MTKKTKHKKIGLALGGGGARGLAHIGVLKVLAEQGIYPDFIAGSSMGAAVGAAFALGYTAKQIEEKVLSFNKRQIVKTFLDFGLPGKAILRGKKISEFLYNYYHGAGFSRTKIPLFITATRLEDGVEVIFEKGSITKAVLASICVPGIFPPVKIGKYHYIDGGVINPTPVDVVKSKGAKKIIAVDLILRRERKIKKLNIATTLLLSYEIIRSQAVKERMGKYGKKTILIKPDLRGTIDSFRFNDVAKFIKAGEIAARQALQNF